MGRLRIISRVPERFSDRAAAGGALAAELEPLKGQSAVVLGIPRGGIIVARELAGELDAELDVVLSRKLRTPGFSELAMGSVSEDGTVFLNDSVVRELGVSQPFIAREKEVQMAEIERRRELIREIRQKVPLAGRAVVITDDGVATGATFQAAIWSARQERPAQLIAAVPVGAEDTVRRLADDVDEMVCLRAPPLFAAVGQFYEDFEPVADAEVIEILGQEARRVRNRVAQ